MLFCRVDAQDTDEYVVASEDSGTARCPFERTHNSTTHYAGIFHTCKTFFYVFKENLLFNVFLRSRYVIQPTAHRPLVT